MVDTFDPFDGSASTSVEDIHKQYYGDQTPPQNVAPAKPQPAANPPPQQDQEKTQGFIAGFEGSVGSENVRAAGLALVMASQLSGSQKLWDEGNKLVALSERIAPSGKEPEALKVKSFGDVWNYAKYALGSTLGSVASAKAGQVAIGAATGAVAGVVAGPEAAPVAATVGGLVGGVGGYAYLQSATSVYDGLIHSPGVAEAVKAGKITPQELVKGAAIAGVPMAAVYTIGLDTTVGKAMFQRLAKTVVKRLAQGAVTGSLALGTASGVAEAIKQAAMELAGDKTPMSQRAARVLESTATGMIGGAVAGAIGNEKRAVDARKEPAIKLYGAAKNAGTVNERPLTEKALDATHELAKEASHRDSEGAELPESENAIPLVAAPRAEAPNAQSTPETPAAPQPPGAPAPQTVAPSAPQPQSHGPLGRALDVGKAHAAAKQAEDLLPVGSKVRISLHGGPPMDVTIKAYHADGMDVTAEDGTTLTLPMNDPDLRIDPIEIAKNPNVLHVLVTKAEPPQGAGAAPVAVAVTEPAASAATPAAPETAPAPPATPKIEAGQTVYVDKATRSDLAKAMANGQDPLKSVNSVKVSTEPAPGLYPVTIGKGGEVSFGKAVEAPKEPPAGEPKPAEPENTANPQPPPQATHNNEGDKAGTTHTVTAANGTKVEVRPEVVEGASLITSADQGYDKSLQPRDRSRAASDQQIREIAGNLQPERLGVSSEADRGAPIVGADNMVESGNGRVAAIRKAYQQGGEAAQRYRDYLTGQGYDISGYKNPVLVQRRVTEMTPDERQAFAVAANQPATMSMSASERALADARRISADDLATLRNPDDLAAAANRDFVRGFMAKLPTTEQGDMLTKEGGLSSAGLTRVRNAVLAKAYGDSPVLARIAESTDDNVKSLSNAMVAAAPDWAKLRAAIEEGHVRGDLDITPQLIDAVRRTADLRAKGASLNDYLAQQDAFDRLPEKVETLMRAFYHPDGRRAASSAVVADTLKRYADQAMKVPAGKTLDLGVPEAQAGDILKNAKERAHERYNGQGGKGGTDLFGAGHESGGSKPTGKGDQVGGAKAQPAALPSDSGGYGAPQPKAAKAEVVPPKGQHDLGDFPLKDGVPLGKQARDYVIERGKATGREHLVAFNDKGKVVSHAIGTENNVNPKNLNDLAFDPKNSIVVHHNHPSSKSLSPADIGYTAAPGIHTVWAHGHDGSAYSARLTPQARSKVARMDPVDALIHTRQVAQTVIDKIGHRLVMGLALRNEKLPDAEVGKTIYEAANRVLRDAGITHYTSDAADPKPIIERAGMDDYVKTLTRDARREFYGSHDGKGDGLAPEKGAKGDLAAGPTVGDRHIGNVGTLSGGLAERGFREPAGQEASGRPRAIRDRLDQAGARSRIAPQGFEEQSIEREARRFARTGILRRLPRNVAEFADFIKGLPESARGFALGLLPTNALPDWADKPQTAVGQYIRTERDMRAYRNKMHEAADDLANEWRKVVSRSSQRTALALSDLMHDSTLAGIDPTKTDEVTKAKPGYDDLRSRYERLPKAAQAIYSKVRDALRRQADEYDKVLLERVGRALDQDIEAAKGDKSAEQKARFNKAARLAALRRRFESSRQIDPYFPLSRFGKYYITVRDAAGKVLSFSRRETAAQKNTLQREMQAAFPKSKGYKVEAGLLPEVDPVKMLDQNMVADITAILGKAGVDSGVLDQVWQRYLQTLPDMSIRKRFIHRKGTPGFHRDALRSFSNLMYHGAHQIARAKYGDVLGRLADDAYDQAESVRGQQIANEIKKRHQWLMNPKGSKISQAITTLGFLWYLGASPASAIVNLSQTAILGLPILGARYGEAKSAAALTKASYDFMAGKGGVRGGNLTPSELKAIDDLYDRGTLDETRAHDLAGLSQSGAEYSPIKSKVVKGLSFLFHHAERFNREVTALAAYRLARGAGLTHADAVDKAAELTWMAHFDYDSANRPRYMEGPAARPLLLFKNFQVNMLYRLMRDTHQMFRGETPAVRAEARKQLAGIMGMLALAGGATGVPLVNQVVIPLWHYFFGDQDNEKSAGEDFRDHVLDALGPQLGGLVMDGVPGYLTGTSLTSRIAMPDLWFQSPDRVETAKEWYYDQLEQFLGPIEQAGHNFYNGYEVIKDGKGVARGIEMMMPQAAKNLMRAWRYANEGVLNMKGEAVVPKDQVGFDDVLKQAIGFTPAKVAEQYTRNDEKKNIESRINDKRQSLLNAFTSAAESGDRDAQQKALADIRAFNAVPIHANKITGRTIRDSIRQRNRLKSRAEGGVIVENRALNAMIDRALPPRVY